MPQDGRYMRLAIHQARSNFKSLNGGPFGACIVKGKRVLAVAKNEVLKKDATCHAEINAIRIASKKLKSFNLTGCVIYSTTEPCPMCFAAIHWARINTIVYGSSVSGARKIGFNELDITNRKMKAACKATVKIRRSTLAGECDKLFEDWARLPRKIVY